MFLKPLEWLLPLLILLASCINKTAVKEHRGVIAGKGMVVTAHHEASRVGAEVIRSGGNAVDAAVAVELALAICYPSAGNIGGGGFMVIRQADGRIHCLDYREKAPDGATRNMFLGSEKKVIDGLSTRSLLASGVPGTVAGLCEAHRMHGRLPWARIVEPAVKLARDGFPVTARQAASMNQMKERFLAANSRSIPLVKDTPWEEGDTLVQTDLATTIERIMNHGHNGFYTGETARMLVEQMKEGKGLITMKDMADYRAIWREPMTGKYKSYRVISVPPPSAGGTGLLQLLKMAEAFPLSDWGREHPNTIHVMLEAERRVYADRVAFLGDPDFVDIPACGLLDSSYLRERMNDMKMETAGNSSVIREGAPVWHESEETTHYSIVDPGGNAVAGTTTLNGSYGSGIMVKGAGFLLNNQMDDFSIKPGYPNLYGLVGSEPNAIQPGKRMLSSMTPTIVEKDGRLFMVAGTPGGSTIVTSVFQTILNVVEHGMGMQEAVAAGRFHHQWLPDTVYYEEKAMNLPVIRELEKRGHRFQKRSSIGRVDAILVLPDGRLEAGADPRGDDTAEGINH